MPELPDIRLYLHALAPRIVGRQLLRIDILTPFLLRTVTPGPEEFVEAPVVTVGRLGKRVVIACSDERFLVIHLMIAGRLRWRETGGTRSRGAKALAALVFENGTLSLTEAGSKRRASLHLVRGASKLESFRRGGVDLEQVSLEEFTAAITRENHTLKRILTDPTIVDGVGNAYSDEILHRAKLSPLTLSSRLSPERIARLQAAGKAVLNEWSNRLIQEAGTGWPEKVTAFRPEMAVHGRYGQPCPVCASPVQRIRYAENETNYCPACQTDGRLLADRALSRLLRADWPRSLALLEERLGGADPNR
jgi:formamidopyrimidine-DNA glycosylase